MIAAGRGGSLWGTELLPGGRPPGRRATGVSEVQSGPATISPELRDRLLYYAWRAPSPHNAQGWRIDADGPSFRVSRDRSRQVLREFDPQGRESDLACGAVVTNLCVAAAAFGFGSEVRWRPTDGVAADVTLLPGGSHRARRPGPGCSRCAAGR